MLFLTRLGANSLADWDEAWYADAARFMFRHDHFLTPIWNGQYFFDKPPLQYWVTQPFLYIFGETELAYRLPSALAAIALTLITYLWEKKRSGILSGLAAAAILLSFPHFLDRGRSGNFDTLFVFLTTLSLFLFIKNKSLLAGIPLGLAWMTKGVFSGLFPIISLIALKGLSFPGKDSPYQTIRTLLTYAAAAAAVYSPWHLLEYTKFDHLIEQSYFATFDQGEFGGWNWMNIAWRFDFRYLVFLWTFLRWWFPVFLIALIYQSLKFTKLLVVNLEGWRAKGPRSSARSLSNVWTRTSELPFISFVVIFLALSAAKSKNDWYIMPAYPFIALMIADFLFTAVIPGLTRNLSKFKTIPLKTKTVITFITFITVIPFSAVNLILHWKQAFPPDKWLPEKELGLTIKNLTNPNDLVITAEYEFPALRYYSEREVRTAARQPDFEGKYWWIWDNTDIATALRHGRDIVTVHRPGTQWPIDVWGYRLEKLGETNDRIISRLLLQTLPQIPAGNAPIRNPLP